MYGIPFIIALILVYLRQKKWHTVEITELIELGNIQDKIEEQTKRLAMLQSEYAKRVDSYQGKYTQLEQDYDEKEKELKKRYLILSNQLQSETKQEQLVLEEIQKSVNEVLTTPETDTAIYDQIPSAEIKNQLSLLSTEEQELQKDDEAIISTSGSEDMTKSNLRK